MPADKHFTAGAKDAAAARARGLDPEPDGSTAGPAADRAYRRGWNSVAAALPMLTNAQRATLETIGVNLRRAPTPGGHTTRARVAALAVASTDGHASTDAVAAMRLADNLRQLAASIDGIIGRPLEAIQLALEDFTPSALQRLAGAVLTYDDDGAVPWTSDAAKRRAYGTSDKIASAARGRLEAATAADVRARIAALSHRCSPDCPGWAIMDSDSRGLEIERCDACWTAAPEDQRPSDHEIAALPEAQAALADEIRARR